MNLRFTLFSAIFLCASVSMVLYSQQKKDTQEPPSHEVTVTLKLIQVYVTDRSGNPVSDLKQLDFILYDNGELRTITEFERHHVTLSESRPAVQAPPTKTVPSPSAAPALSRKFVLFLDFFQNDFVGAGKAKKAALHFLDSTVEAGDEVCILSYQEDKGIVAHSDFTADIPQAHEVIRGIRGSPAKNREPDQKALPEEYEIYRQQNFKFIFDLKELARYLGTVPGYKNLVYFSGGIQRKILYDQYKEARLEEKRDVGLMDIERGMFKEFENMAEDLAASNTKVFSVNTMFARRMLENLDPGERGDHALQLMADYSGGKYFQELDRYEEIAQIIHERTANYYVLGYYVGERWDGKYHSIEVEVKRPGLRVHAQRGYYNPKPYAEFSEFEKSIHLMNLVTSGTSSYKTPVRLSAAALPCVGEIPDTFLLIAQLPVSELEGVNKGIAEFANVVLGAGREVVEMSQGSLSFTRLAGQTVFLYSVQSCPPGKYTCRMVLRNPKTGDSAVASTELDMTGPPDTGIKLWPPLLLQRADNVTYMRVSRSESETLHGIQASIKDVYPFLTNDFAPVVEHIPGDLDRIYAVLRGAIQDVPDPEIELSVELASVAGDFRRDIVAGILDAWSEDGIHQVLFLELEIPEVPAGKFELRITAEEKAQDIRAEVKVPVVFGHSRGYISNY